MVKTSLGLNEKLYVLFCVFVCVFPLCKTFPKTTDVWTEQVQCTVPLVSVTSGIFFFPPMFLDLYFWYFLSVLCSAKYFWYNLLIRHQTFPNFVRFYFILFFFHVAFVGAAIYNLVECCQLKNGSDIMGTKSAVLILQLSWSKNGFFFVWRVISHNFVPVWVIWGKDCFLNTLAVVYHILLSLLLSMKV